MSAIPTETPDPTILHATHIPESSGQDQTPGSTSHSPTASAPSSMSVASGRGQAPPATANEAPVATTATQEAPAGLADPLLVILADAVDDLERTRIANENRLRQLTRDVEDSDGVERGFGLTLDVPQVAQLSRIVTGLADMEHQAILNLQRQMRAHPLGSWVKVTNGLGLKQSARLLSAIGDPYWNTLHNRPRTVSELWAYCGLHVLPAGQARPDVATTDDVRGTSADGDSLRADQGIVETHTGLVGSGQTSDPGHGSLVAGGIHTGTAGVAAKRRKGVRSNWSGSAKMRAYLVATSCIKVRTSPYRDVYLARRVHTAATHPDWTLGHSHNDALRIVSKAVLKDLWLQARDIHGVAP